MVGQLETHLHSAPRIDFLRLGSGKYMAKLEFESVEVPITSRTKWRLWLALSAFVGLLIVSGFNASGGDEHNGRVLAYYSIAALAYTLTRVVRAILQKTERQLTKEGLIQRQAARERDRVRKQQLKERAGQQVEFWAVVAIVLAVVIGAGVWLWRPIADVFSGRITVYPEHCVQLDAVGKCVERGWRADPPTTYTVHADQQFVVGITDEQPLPHKLFNCVIADQSHWTCTVEPDKYSFSLTMNGGDFTAPGRLRYVSRFSWLFDK